MDDQQLDQNTPEFSSPWVRELFPPLATVNFGENRENHPVTIVILTKDEERCIARCLDSVVGRDFDNILVLDTGSTDKTPSIVAGYRQHRVQLVRSPWSNSFAKARNLAITMVATGWIVFLDADEWLTEDSSEQLSSCLYSLSGIEDLSTFAFAPRIRDVDRDTYVNDVPRIFKADGVIRYKGLVHEYPVVSGVIETYIDLVGLDLEFLHDGYNPAVAETKSKRKRNLDLLETARSVDPANPRWLYYTIRDAGLEITSAQLVDLCTTLRGLVVDGTDTGDRHPARRYYRLAVKSACETLVVLGDVGAVRQLCDDLDRTEQHDSPDAHYFRSIIELYGGILTNRDLLRTIRLRSDDDLVATSVIDSSGRHLDALVVALLAKCRSTAEADRYRELSDPWSDMFFKHSVLRTGQVVVR